MAKDERNVKKLNEHDSENVSGGYIHQNTGKEGENLAPDMIPGNDNFPMGDIDPAVMPPFNPFMLRKHGMCGHHKHFGHERHGGAMPKEPEGGNKSE